MRRFNLDTAKCSRLDLHADWQGGDVPTFTDMEVLHFIHPGKVKVACMSERWRKPAMSNTCGGLLMRRVRRRISGLRTAARMSI